MKETAFLCPLRDTNEMRGSHLTWRGEVGVSMIRDVTVVLVDARDGQRRLNVASSVFEFLYFLYGKKKRISANC